MKEFDWNLLEKEELAQIVSILFERVVPKLLDVLDKMTGVIGMSLNISHLTKKAEV